MTDAVTTEISANDSAAAEVAVVAEARPPWAASVGQDRRSSERKPLRGRAQLHFQGRAPMEVRTLEINQGGVGIVAPENLAISASFILHMTLVLAKGLRPLQLKVKVVHNVFSGTEAGFKVGLQFLQLPASASEAVAQYLSGH